jgi:hypothetical protein
MRYVILILIIGQEREYLGRLPLTMSRASHDSLETADSPEYFSTRDSFKFRKTKFHFEFGMTK